MTRSFNYTISLVLAAVAWGPVDRAEAQSPSKPPAKVATGDAAPGGDGAPSVSESTETSEPAASAAPDAADRPLTLDEQIEAMAKQAESEVIEVWAERPDKPFDRDTKLRITGEELAARGVTDLGQALATLTDVQVREAGRGGSNIDIRGARKGSVRVLIDGISVSDPYYGTFDVSTIPVTDIEQIRVSTSPSSPIDGPGGPGGVIEVHTRDAIGAQMVRARVTTDTGPTFGVAGSARAGLSQHTAIRLSVSGTAGARDFDLPMDATVGESRRTASGASRLEYRRGARRLVFDAGFDDRHYVNPPSDEFTNSILLIDRETTMRSLVGFEDKVGKLQVSARSWADRMRRRSRYFRDATFSEETQSEDLRALRVGGQVLATRPIGRSMRWAASATVDRDSAEVVIDTGARAEGDALISQLAADLQLEGEGFLVDGAVGVAVPFGIDADPWFEAKLDARYTPFQGLEIAAIAAQKGRAPSLRERFDPISGNEELDPELARHGEVRLTGKHRGVTLEVAPFVRRSTGTVRLEPKLGRQVNIGQLDVKGVDTRLEVALMQQRVTAGGAYSYITATSDNLGDDPLDRLPAHRYDLWLKVAPMARLSAQGRFRYIGRRLDQGTMLGSYTAVEASVTSQLTDEYLAVLRVDDVMDDKPEIRNGYRSQGRLYSLMLQGTWQ
jgi:outer membrane receptor protein involved in Fe transport